MYPSCKNQQSAYHSYERIKDSIYVEKQQLDKIKVM